MALLSYYVAQSLDGYIADTSHGVAWLESFVPDEPASVLQEWGDREAVFKYEDYLKSVGAVVMGRKTYDFLVQFGSNPYAHLDTWVLSRTLGSQSSLLPGVKLVPQDLGVVAFLQGLKARPERRVWLVGGGDSAAQAMQAGLLDEIILSIVPRTLGAGVPLFKSLGSDLRDWKLMQASVTRNGFVQLVYRPG